MKYNVNNIYPCIQGEGALTGIPMVMLRLQGCPVGCSFCDTKETWQVNPTDEQPNYNGAKGVNSRYWGAVQSEITHYINSRYKTLKWVLLSGGEPAINDLTPLTNSLHDAGYKIALETSGTADGLLDAGIDWVCISPKVDMSGGLKLIPEVFPLADEIKYVIGKQSDLTKLDKLLNEMELKKGVTICLQPLSQSNRATKLCIEVAIERGYRLSIQTHKYLQID